MPTDTQDLRIPVAGLGNFVLHGNDKSKQAIVLNSLASASRAEVVGLVMGAAYGPDAVQEFLAAVGDPDLTQAQIEERTFDVVSRTWPEDAVISLAVLDEGEEDRMQEISFDLQDPNRTLAGALALTDSAMTFAPLYR